VKREEEFVQHEWRRRRRRLQSRYGEQQSVCAESLYMDIREAMIRLRQGEGGKGKVVPVLN
jgi:hypothetical protein